MTTKSGPPRTERIQRAVDRVLVGEIAYRVARDTGVSLKYLYRVLKRERLSPRLVRAHIPPERGR